MWFLRKRYEYTVNVDWNGDCGYDCGYECSGTLLFWLWRSENSIREEIIGNFAVDSLINGNPVSVKVTKLNRM